jgi:hypothetical protein
MAIQPHCVACWDVDVAGSVEFADHVPSWRQPTGPEGVPIVGWSNELGVTAPPGIGLFCKRHLRQARRLRHLPAAEAVRQLSQDDAAGGGLWSRLRARVK